MADFDTDVVIPEDKIRAAHARCMQDPALAKYFQEAPPGAKQYIALMFYCTVYQDEIDDAKCEIYQAEVEEDLTKEDLLYLATHERNPESKTHFRELYVEMVNAERAAARAVDAPVPALNTAPLERTIDALQQEVHALRRIVGAQAARPDPAPGALTLGLLAALLTGLAYVPNVTGGLVMALSLSAALFAFSAAVRRKHEPLAPRIAGGVFAGLALLGDLVLFVGAILLAFRA